MKSVWEQSKYIFNGKELTIKRAYKKKKCDTCKKPIYTYKYVFDNKQIICCKCFLKNELKPLERK